MKLYKYEYWIMSDGGEHIECRQCSHPFSDLARKEANLYLEWATVHYNRKDLQVITMKK